LSLYFDGSRAVRREELKGGSLNLVERIELADGRCVVLKSGDGAASESRMLRDLAAQGYRTVEILGEEPGRLWLALIPSTCEFSWDKLAVMLRDAWDRKPHADRAFGYERDTAFAEVPVSNEPQAKWTAFYADKRLRCHAGNIPNALCRRVEALAERMHDLLPDKPTPILLHGDLWGGNILSDPHGPVLIDPACYYGHAEVDIAMLSVFDRPPKGFYDALSLEPGWQERQHVYRLWPLLVHLRLFGDSYRGAVERELEALGF
jgi:hypothetical protein